MKGSNSKMMEAFYDLQKAIKEYVQEYHLKSVDDLYSVRICQNLSCRPCTKTVCIVERRRLFVMKFTANAKGNWTSLHLISICAVLFLRIPIDLTLSTMRKWLELFIGYVRLVDHNIIKIG